VILKNNGGLFHNIQQILFYGINGIINTAATYTLYLVLIRLMLIDYRVSIVLAYIPGIYLSYLLNRKLAFGTSGYLFRFVLVSIAMFFVNLSVTWFIVEYIGIGKELAQLIAIGIVFVLGFTLNKIYSFAPRKEDHRSVR
jgi:putative flippase GtrA